MKKSYFFLWVGFVCLLAGLAFVAPAQAAAPAPPTDLEVVGGHYSYITMSWTDNSSNEESFAIYRKAATDLAFTHIATLSANTRKYKDEGLDPDTTYFYKVLAHNRDGNSAFSNQASASTSEHPNIRVLSPNGGEVWRAGETRYITWTVDAELYQGIEYFALDDTGHSTGDTLLTGIEPDIHTYRWTVPDVDSDQVFIRVWGHPADSGETFSDDSDGYFTIVPRLEAIPMGLPAPSNLVLDQDASEVTLNWQDNSSSELGFRIYYRINDGEASVLDTVGPNTTSYTVELSPGNSYSFRMQAFNAMTVSGYSNSVNTTIPEETTEVDPEGDVIHSPGAGQTVLRFTIDSAEYYVQGPSDTSSRLQTMDTAPIISGGRTLLPIRYVSEPLGADVDWDGALDQVTVQLGGHTIILWINNNTANINGKSVPIDPSNPAVTPIIVSSGRTMLPLRFIAENLGCQVDWNAELRQVTVTYPKP